MRKKYLIIGGLVTGLLLLLLLLVNVTQNGSLEVSAPETPNNANVEVTITFEKGGTQSFTVAPKSTRTVNIQAGTHRVDSKAGDVKAVDIVKVEASKTAKLTLRFATQMVAQKVGTDAEYCPQVVDQTVYSYNCQGDGFIYRHPSADARKIPLFESQYFNYVKPYNTGFLGFPIIDPNDTSHTNLRLHFINMKTQTMTAVPLPADIPLQNLANNVTIVTSSDQTKAFFALVVRDQSKIYLFESPADTTPAAFSMPTDKKIVGDNNSTSFTFDGETLIAYIGKIVNGEENDGQEDDGAEGVGTATAPLNADGKIFEYDLQGKLGKTINVPNDFWGDVVTRLTDKYYAASNIRGNTVYFLRDNRLEPIYNISDGTSTLTAKGQLYMVVDNGIFAFTPQENGLFSLQNVYNSANLRVSSLYDSTGPVLFTAYNGDAVDAKLDIYTLTKP
jgi:hypothetical protein